MKKKSQEEMVGFALIVIITSIVIVFLLFFIVSSPQKKSVESFELESFIQVALQYTTKCEDYLGNLSIREVIIKCNDKEMCLNNIDSCTVLNETLRGILNESWKIGENSPIKGYNFQIKSYEDEILLLKEGNETLNYKTALESLGYSEIKTEFKVYY